MTLTSNGNLVNLITNSLSKSNYKRKFNLICKDKRFHLNCQIFIQLSFWNDFAEDHLPSLKRPSFES